MKLQGETVTTTKEAPKGLFPLKPQMAREPEVGIHDHRHLECEKGDRGIVTKFLQKVSASALFGTKTYSFQRRSKSQERGSSTFSIKPFSNKNTLPVLKTFAKDPREETKKKVGSGDSRRLSYPNLFTNSNLQLAKNTGEGLTKDKSWLSESTLIKTDQECDNKDNKNVEASPPKNPGNAKLNISHIIEVPVEIVQKQSFGNTSSVKVKDKIKNDAASFTNMSTKEDLKENIPNTIKDIIAETNNGVTKIQIRYSGLSKDETERSQNSPIPEKQDAPNHGNSDLKLPKEDVTRALFESAANSSKRDPPRAIPTITPKPNICLSSTSTPPLSSLSSSSSSSPTSSPPQVIKEPPLPQASSFDPSLWSLRASSSSAKKSSKSNPGRLTIRPASNLNASKLKSEFLKLTEFNDIKTGEFAAPLRPKKETKSFDENEEEVLCSLEDIPAGEMAENGEREDEEVKKIEFIGAGVIQGKSMLSKSKSNKRRSVNFSEAPVIHVIENVPCGDDDDDPFDDSNERGSTTNLLSSITSSSSKGGLSSYKSKTLLDFEFDFETPPPEIKTNSKWNTCREELNQKSSASEEVLPWSSNSTLDLLF